jgi:hypothetical protein
MKFQSIQSMQASARTARTIKNKSLYMLPMEVVSSSLPAWERKMGMRAAAGIHLNSRRIQQA